MPAFKDDLPAAARPFESRLQVQWADVDIAGIMYFAAYWRFAEYAEQQMFEELGFPFEKLFDAFDFWMPRVHVEADYHAPAKMGDWIRMRTHVERIGASSIRYKVVMIDERTATVHAVMTLTIASMDRTTQKSMRLPGPLREALITRTKESAP
jgi:YbgC/YbaW family acyl-CoA thioester hydrolase